MKYLFTLGAGAIAMLLSACASMTRPDAGVYLNASFEARTPDGHPVGWYIEADASTAGVSVTREPARDGRHALHLRNTGNDPVVLYTPLGLGDRCIRSLSASAWVRPGEGSPAVSLFHLVPGVAPVMGGAAAVQEGGWSRAELAVSSNEDCLAADSMLGLLMAGHGEARVDGIEVETVGDAYTVRRHAPRGTPSREELDALEQVSVSLPAGDPEGNGCRDETLGERLPEARIVGLGENSHGAAALFGMKFCLTRHLVERRGFDVFALEMPEIAARQVNAYVSGRTDDERAALYALSYPSWQSREMWRVIAWLREHNRDTDRPVRLVGLDPDEGRDLQGTVDEGMAVVAGENLDAGSSRMLIWADNTHVTKHGNALGALLAREYGDDYLSVGMTFDRGMYSAYGPEKQYRVHPGYPGTHEYVLARASRDRFLFDPEALPEGHVLRQRLGFRYIGSMPQPLHQFMPHVLTEHFDVVGFVGETGATTYLLEHEF